MPVSTRRAARAGQGDEPVAPYAVELPLVDLPEWVENTLQVVSFGAFTPRSAERRAVEAAARLGREAASADVAVELDYEEYVDGGEVLPSPLPEARKSPRLLSAATALRALDATEARAAEARLKARATAEAAAAARVAMADDRGKTEQTRKDPRLSVAAAAADDSDEVDEILRSRGAKLKRGVATSMVSGASRYSTRRRDDEPCAAAEDAVMSLMWCMLRADAFYAAAILCKKQV